jgi:hypothetical protein
VNNSGYIAANGWLIQDYNVMEAVVDYLKHYSVTCLELVKSIQRLLGNYVRIEVFTAVTMKNGVFWDVTPCGSSKKRSFGGA